MAGRRSPRRRAAPQGIHSVLTSEPLVRRVDYVSVAHAETMEELDAATAGAMVSTAAWLGNVRLIDNVVLWAEFVSPHSALLTICIMCRHTRTIGPWNSGIRGCGGYGSEETPAASIPPTCEELLEFLTNYS